jgi:flagellar motor protein MotB
VLNGIRLYKTAEEEAEKPFWISYADLMTSLMVLFLLVMLASLVSLGRTVTELQSTRNHSEVLAQRYEAIKRAQNAHYRLQQQRNAQITRFWDELQQSTRGLGVTIDRTTGLINFGTRGLFASGSDVLSDQDQLLLRRFAPHLLTIAASKLGRTVLDQVVVEGFADPQGSYLFNLNLSLDRSQRVLCTLLHPGGPAPLSNSDKQSVVNLFLVGGFSFNDTLRSFAASRRVELRIQFLPLGAHRSTGAALSTGFGDCSLPG